MSLRKSLKHQYKGIGDCDSQCYIRIYEGFGRDEGMVVVIVTQIIEDDGTSITNWVEQLATAITTAERISPNRLIWIEHYPEERDEFDVESEESYKRVTFDYSRGAYRDPEWHHIVRADVEAMIGQQLATASVDVDDPHTVVNMGSE